MQVVINKSRLELVEGDITQQDTEAIVNAANPSLLGGGGVDGAIHRAAGPQLLAECRTLGGCPTGEARITRGYRLKARYVIHTVGPIYYLEGPKAPGLLASAYCSSLALASQRSIKSIAFPSLSTGAYGYPVKEAARVALASVLGHCRATGGSSSLESVTFVLFTGDTLRAYEGALDELAGDESS